MSEFFVWLVLLGILAKAGTTSWAAFAVGALVFGSLWFWILAAIVSACVFAFIDHDDGVGATGTLVAFFLALQLFGDVKAFSFVATHPLRVAEWLAGYFLAGTLWSIAKWWFHCRAKREEYDEQFKAGQRNGLPQKPSASDSKDKILRWMTFWPWSMIWTIINDPIKKAFRVIFRKLQAKYQQIADKAWEGVSK